MFVKSFKTENLDRGLIQSNVQPAMTAILVADNGNWIGVSRYHDEDYWVADCAFRENGYPIFSNGTGSRCTAGRILTDEDTIEMLNKFALVLPDCLSEFGEHNEHHDCGRMLDTMAGEGVDDGSDYADALNREAEENMLGRPLFPNEY